MLNEIIKQFIEQLADEIRQAIPKVTGKTSEAVTTEYPDGLTGIIYAPGWIEVFETGRKPGTMPPVSPIQAWVEAKGLTAINKSGKQMTSNSLAWAIAMNMKKNGNTLWRALNGGEIRYSPLAVEFNKIFSKDRIDSFVNVFEQKYRAIIISNIISV